MQLEEEIAGYTTYTWPKHFPSWVQKAFIILAVDLNKTSIDTWDLIKTLHLNLTKKTTEHKKYLTVLIDQVV